MSKERELLARAFESMKNRTLLTENERNLEKEISYYLLSTPELTQNEEPVAWGMTDSVGKIVDTITESDREGEMAEWSHQYPVPLFLHPAPCPEFVRLSDDEISELWSKAEDAHVFARDIEILSREKNK